MRTAILGCCLLLCFVPVGCAYLAPREYVLPGPDGEYGTPDDEFVMGPSKAQELLEGARPIADGLGFGHYAALLQGLLALITQGAGLMMSRREDGAAIT